MSHHFLAALAALLFALLTGCSSAPPVRQTGFLTDYSKLEKISPQRMEYYSPRLRDYNSFIVDAVEFRVPPTKLTPEERSQLAAYYRAKASDALQKLGLSVVSDPAPGVARIGLALTDIAESTWWMKIHPGARIAGAGTGGASMETEIVDSITGEQLAAAVAADAGNQFNLTAFSTVADIESAIDSWTVTAARRWEQLRRTPPK
jgi:hypothetical protein